MPNQKKTTRSGSEGDNKKIDDNNININLKKSSLAEFTKRPLPTEKEVEKFEEMIAGASSSDNGIIHKDLPEEDEAREEEIEESLHEIYQDDNGDMVNVKKMDIKKRHGFLFWFFALIFWAIAGYGAYYAYNFYLQPGSDATAVEFFIAGENEILSGEEFFYTVNYRNLSNINLKNARIKLSYPDNFIFLDSLPESAEDNSVWKFFNIPPNYNGKIRIKGKMIGPEDMTGIVLAHISYTPENFSSEFKKEASLTTTIRDIGLNFDFDYLSNVLLGEENEIVVKYRFN